MYNVIQKEYNLKFKGYINEGVKKYKGRFYMPYLPVLFYSFPSVFLNSDIWSRVVTFLTGN